MAAPARIPVSVSYRGLVDYGGSDTDMVLQSTLDFDVSPNAIGAGSYGIILPAEQNNTDKVVKLQPIVNEREKKQFLNELYIQSDASDARIGPRFYDGVVRSPLDATEFESGDDKADIALINQSLRNLYRNRATRLQKVGLIVINRYDSSMDAMFAGTGIDEKITVDMMLMRGSDELVRIRDVVRLIEAASGEFESPYGNSVRMGRQLRLLIERMHSDLGVVHADLVARNILYKNAGGLHVLAISDYGLAERINEIDVSRVNIGSQIATYGPIIVETWRYHYRKQFLMALERLFNRPMIRIPRKFILDVHNYFLYTILSKKARQAEALVPLYNRRNQTKFKSVDDIVKGTGRAIAFQPRFADIRSDALAARDAASDDIVNALIHALLERFEAAKPDNNRNWSALNEWMGRWIAEPIRKVYPLAILPVDFINYPRTRDWSMYLNAVCAETLESGRRIGVERIVRLFYRYMFDRDAQD